MVRVLATILLAVAMAAAQESRPESRAASRPVAESRRGSLRDLLETGHDVVDAITGNREWGKSNRMINEGLVLKDQGRVDEALAVFEKLRQESPEARTISCLLAVSIHWERGDLDAAEDLLESELATPGADEQDRVYAWHFLAETEERRGDFAKALEAWKKANPVEGTELIADSFGQAYDQEFGLARCEFRLGRVDEALRRLERCLVKAGARAKEDSAWAFHRYEALRLAFAYAEDSGKSGRIAAARTFAATLPPEIRSAVLESIAIVEAWLTKDPAAIAKALPRNPDSALADGAGRLIGELGPPGVAWLRRGIESGDLAAINLAAASARPELLPALEKRAAAGGQDGDAADQAIDRLALATASRPSTRPSSRPASRPGK